MDAVSSPAALSYSYGASGPPLLGQTIGDNLRAAVERYGGREALVVCSQDYRATYRQLWDAVTQAARGLLALGVAAGDRVGVWSPNRQEWVVVQYSTARIGAILVNINPAYQAAELEYALRLSGVSLLFHARGFRQLVYEPLLEAARPRCSALQRVVRFDDDWPTFLAAGDSVASGDLDRRETSLQFDDPINIQYTSGTTGFPKGATLTHHNILNNGFFVGEAIRLTEHDRVCIPVPLYHCFGMVLGCLACTSHGACMVFPAECFNAPAVLRAVGAERCTALYGVPTMFRALLEDASFADTDCSSLRTGIMAGSPCPIELMREVTTRLHMPEAAIAYGMTETSSVSTMSGRDDPLERRVTTVGRVLPHLEVCIKDSATGTAAPRGQAGELCTRGYSLMRGYWDDDAATRAAVDAGGWMHSGDLAVMDEAGYVHIVGRLKDMIIRGGENVYPREVEAVLHQHPAVSEAQVIGVPNRKYGEEIMAWVRLAPGAAATEEELERHCRERLAAYKRPRYWRFVETFPLTVTGKVQKYRLREMAVEMLGLQQEAGERTA
jgi:fatty-acyl-CoA synthase